jgi:hypothetical protein
MKNTTNSLLLENNLLYNTDMLHPELPASMSMFLNYWEDNYNLAMNLQQAIIDRRIAAKKGDRLKKQIYWHLFLFPRAAVTAMHFASMWPRRAKIANWR